MIQIPKLDKRILPYPPQKNYKKLLVKWLEKNPWVTIGDGVMFPLETKILGTRVHIKDGTIINGPMVIKGSGNVTIGKYGGIGENLYIISSNHKTDYADIGGMFSENVDVNKGSIYIGNNVWIGDNVTILTGVNIGDGAAIGTGSIVTHDIPPFAIAVGAPARVIKYRFSKKVISKLMDISWWHWNYETILKNKFFFNTSINDKNINELGNKLNLEDEKEITNIDFSKENVNDYLLNGWWEKELDRCWTSNNESSFYFKIQNTDKYKFINFIGHSFYKSQKMTVFINQKKIGKTYIGTEQSINKIKIYNLHKGINTIKLVFEKGTSPSSVGISSDKRILYCGFSRFILL